MTKPLPKQVNAILECTNLKKQFPHRGGFVVALDGVSASFEPGEWVGVKGYSGSGKSTLLNLLTGLDVPTTGNLSFLGNSYRSLGVNGLSALRRKWIGIVLQEIALIGHLTAQENIELPALLSGRPHNDLRIRALEWINLLRLDNREDHFPDELSAGERQRVAIARALMIDEAKILVADEPTASVDSRNAREIADIFRKLVERGLCVITASHDDRLLQHADRVLHIEDGKLSPQDSK